MYSKCKVSAYLHLTTFKSNGTLTTLQSQTASPVSMFRVKGHVYIHSKSLGCK